MPKRPCIDCGKLGTDTRCEEHQRQHRAGYERGRPLPPHHATRYDWTWRKESKRIRDEWVATWGARGLPPQCPGWRVPPHPTTAQQLVVDHDFGVMCRACNSRKAAIDDKATRQG